MKNVNLNLNQYNNLKKEEMVSELYFDLQNNHEVTILNDKFLIVDGVTYSFRKKQGEWTSKAI